VTARLRSGRAARSSRPMYEAALARNARVALRTGRTAHFWLLFGNETGKTSGERRAEPDSGPGCERYGLRTRRLRTYFLLSNFHHLRNPDAQCD
jgi:hypothetical protein